MRCLVCLVTGWCRWRHCLSCVLDFNGFGFLFEGLFQGEVLFWCSLCVCLF